MEIWFHGTNETAANSILKEGFKVGTYFARHLESALAYGGPFVFEVALDRSLMSEDVTWQLHTMVPIGVEDIVGLTKFEKTILEDNPKLRLEIFQSNLDGSIDGFVGKVEEHRW
jgi:hypothetical protein